MGHANISFNYDRGQDSMTTVLNLRSQSNLASNRLSEEIYSNWLDETFKPVFDKYDNEEMPTEVLLMSLCKESGGLPRQRLNRLFLRLDSNKDGKVTYQEFRTYMIHIEPRDRSFTKKVLISLALKSCPDLIDSYLPTNHCENNKTKEDIYQLKSDMAETYLDMHSCYPPPIFIPLLMVAQMITFVVYGFQLIRENNPNNRLSWTTGLPKSSSLIFDVRKRQEFWRFITYLLIHQGYLHIIFNCFIQLLLGIPLEMVHKFWRVGPVFLAGVLSGSLVSSVFDNSKLVGSSGGSYALIGAHYAIIIMHWEDLQRDWLNIGSSIMNFIASGVARLMILTSFLAADLGLTLYRRLGLNVDERTSCVAHLGGLITGILVGIPCLRKNSRELWKEKIFWLSLLIYSILLTSGILSNIFHRNIE